MGFAGKLLSYERRHVITSHAVDRLRERARDADLAAQDNRQLGNLLDDAVEAAIREGKAETIWNDGIDGTLVDISHLINVDLFAIVVPERNQPSAFSEVVKTLMTRDMVEKKRASGSWIKRPPEAPTPKNGAFATLGDKLGKLQLAPPPPLPIDEPRIADAAEEAPAAKPAAWISRADVAALLEVTYGRAGSLASSHGWRKKRKGGIVYYDRATVDAYAASRDPEAIARGLRLAEAAKKARIQRGATAQPQKSKAPKAKPPTAKGGARDWIVTVDGAVSFVPACDVAAIVEKAHANGAGEVHAYKPVPLRMRVEVGE